MRSSALVFVVLSSASALAGAGPATSPKALGAEYTAQAGEGFRASVERGRSFYASPRSARGTSRSCASCHADDPRTPGRSAAGKTIEPLAPAPSSTRFTDRAKSEKWFRRNCTEVLGRECTPAEKADLITYLLAAASS